MTRPRTGATVVELLVALVVLAVGLGAVGSAVAWAQHAASTARSDERALAVAAALLDSLALDTAAAPGALALPGARFAWTVDGAEVRLRYALPSGRDSVRRELRLRVFAAPAPVLAP